MPPVYASTQGMSFFRTCLRFICLIAALSAGIASSNAQESETPELDLEVPGITEFAAPENPASLAIGASGSVMLSAQLTEDGEEIPKGLVWRVFSPVPGPDGTLPLVATAEGGTEIFDLPPGSYLVHAAYGRAGATKRITVGSEDKREVFVLDAGGLKLDAMLADGGRIPANRLRFSIYEKDPDATGERALIVPDIKPGSVVRLNAGTYHVESTYGSVNAVIRSDIRVGAGELTEATVEHRAAQLTMKLVRESGGEAIADTAWSILTESGEIVREMVGAYASMVLAEGEYTVVAKNRDRIYQKDFTVVPGRNRDVELLPENLAETPDGFID
ncbi:hypothetical protein [Nitratireductor basaltis]|uniref:Carboxypeptidase regulatory-like domain-containing protein n=1 Tax=Nitratireductor basaltis TaxID=472175 RepID=A0A084UBA9_9HYPH|nr:hypothetical protein [Nitratireductor basaltis]KFB10245.1 hypothetical protein EL18_01275 [Nitratireductor basaltis]